VGVSQTLWRWTEGATYIWQGDHYVGHWPTFLVSNNTMVPAECTHDIWQQVLRPQVQVPKPQVRVQLQVASTTYLVSILSTVKYLELINIHDGGQQPSWKPLNRYISGAIWPIFTKSGMVIGYSFLPFSSPSTIKISNLYKSKMAEVQHTGITGTIGK